MSFLFSLQDEVAHKQKLKDEKKALEQAKAKALQKGPMGRVQNLFSNFGICIGNNMTCSGIWQ